MYILGTPEGPLNVTIMSEVGKYVLSFSYHPVIGDIYILYLQQIWPCKWCDDNPQARTFTNPWQQAGETKNFRVWSGDLTGWQAALLTIYGTEIQHFFRFFFDCHSLKIPPISRHEKHWETKFAIFFSLQNLNWTFFIIAFQLRSKARQSRRRLHWKTRNFEERPMRNVETSETSNRFT